MCHARARVDSRQRWTWPVVPGDTGNLDPGIADGERQAVTASRQPKYEPAVSRMLEAGENGGEHLGEPRPRLRTGGATKPLK